MKKYRLQNNLKNSFSFSSPLSLEDFSSELDNQLNMLREVDANNINLKIREQQERFQNRNSIDRKQKGSSQICLPFIKPIPKYKKKKKQICILPLIENIANKIEARLQKIQKANQNYSSDLQKYKQIVYQQPSSPRPQIILIPQYNPMPMPIPMPMNYYNNYPSIPMNYQNYSYPNNQIQKQNEKFSTSHSLQPLKTKQKIQNSDSINRAEMENRKNKLRRKLRICFIAVYFMFLFRTYTQIVRYVRFQKYLQIQDIITEEYEGLQSDLFHTLVHQDFFQKFRNFTKKSENRRAKQKPNSSDVYFIQIDDEQVQINVSAFQDFFSDFLSEIEDKMNNQQLKAMMPIFVHFIRDGYAFNQIFLLEQLSTINFYLPQRKLNIDPQLSKALIINFIFLKIIVGKLLCKKEVLNMLYKIYRRRPEQKKYTLLYGKKLTIALVLFYKAINQKFFKDFKNLSGNYASLKSDSKVIPMDSLQYQFSLSQEDEQNKQEKNELIKKIRSPAHLEQEFISSFQQNWAKIQEIADKMYQETVLEKKQQIILLKQQILEQEFPSRSEIKVVDSLKRMKTRMKTSNKFDIGKLTIGNNAFKGLATIKRMAARKTQIQIAGQRKPTVKQTQSKTNSIQISQNSESEQKLAKKKKS